MLLLLAGKSALETAYGKRLYNYNVGNRKEYDSTKSHIEIQTFEWVEDSQLRTFRAAGPPGSVGPIKRTEVRADGKTYHQVDVFPGHRESRFQAYPTLDAGVAAHVADVKSRFERMSPAEQAAVVHGDRDAIARMLKGYSTADAGAYADQVIGTTANLKKEWAKQKVQEELDAKVPWPVPNIPYITVPPKIPPTYAPKAKTVAPTFKLAF